MMAFGKKHPNTVLIRGSICSYLVRCEQLLLIKNHNAHRMRNATPVQTADTLDFNVNFLARYVLIRFSPVQLFGVGKNRPPDTIAKRKPPENP